MKFAAAVCSFLIIAIITTDDGVQRQRKYLSEREVREIAEIRRT